MALHRVACDSTPGVVTSAPSSVNRSDNHCLDSEEELSNGMDSHDGNEQDSVLDKSSSRPDVNRKRSHNAFQPRATSTPVKLPKLSDVQCRPVRESSQLSHVSRWDWNFLNSLNDFRTPTPLVMSWFSLICPLSSVIIFYLINQLIRCTKSTVSWSSNGKSWISGPTIPLYVSITYEAIEDNSRYIVNWWSWKFKSRTGTRGAAVRYWLSNCEVAGSVPTRVRWCALLKSSKQNETAVQCSSQFSAFNFTD